MAVWAADPAGYTVRPSDEIHYSDGGFTLSPLISKSGAVLAATLETPDHEMGMTEIAGHIQGPVQYEAGDVTLTQTAPFTLEPPCLAVVHVTDVSLSGLNSPPSDAYDPASSGPAGQSWGLGLTGAGPRDLGGCGITRFLPWPGFTDLTIPTPPYWMGISIHATTHVVPGSSIIEYDHHEGLWTTHTPTLDSVPDIDLTGQGPVGTPGETYTGWDSSQSRPAPALGKLEAQYATFSWSQGPGRYMIDAITWNITAVSATLGVDGFIFTGTYTPEVPPPPPATPSIATGPHTHGIRRHYQ